MICGRRVRGDTQWRCWSVHCAGCRKTYRTVASRIVDDILADYQDLRTVWWLPVDCDYADELTTNWRRLRQILTYHGQKPEKYIWFLTEAGDSIVQYTITDQLIDSAVLDRHWLRYSGSLETAVARRDRDQLRRAVAFHAGELSPELLTGERMGSSQTLPGVTPRRNSKGQPRPPSNEVAYRSDVLAD